MKKSLLMALFIWQMLAAPGTERVKRMSTRAPDAFYRIKKRGCYLGISALTNTAMVKMWKYVAFKSHG